MKKIPILMLILLLFIPIVFSYTTFSSHTISQLGKGRVETFDIVDIDGDGDYDAVSDIDFGVALSLNNGLMGFADAYNITVGFNWITDVMADDFNEDGDIDYYIATEYYSRIGHNDGNELFTTRQYVYKESCDIKKTDYGDIDLDYSNDIDFVIVCHNPPTDEKIVWIENLYDGSWSDTSATDNWENHTVFDGDADNHQWNDIKLVDLDEDGDLDIIGCANTEDILTWYENEGGGESWTEHDIHSVYCLDTVVIDLDSDNDLDIIVNGNNNLTWYENNGLESFTSHTIIDVLTTGYGVSAGDLDGDNDIDIAYINSTEIYWAENNGIESFTTHLIFDGTAVNKHYVKIIDLDLDGDLDIVTSDGTIANSRLRWFENDYVSSEVTTCPFPTLFCDNFNYADALQNHGWLVFEMGDVLNGTFAPINNTLNLSDDKNRFPYHETEVFDVTYRPDSSSAFTRHYFAPVFSSQFDLKFSNTTDNIFKYAGYERQFITAYQIIIQIDSTGNASGDMNWYYLNETQPSTIWTLICGNCTTSDNTINVKINSFFSQRDDFPFNSSIDDDEIHIYADDKLLGIVEDFYDARTTYISQYQFIKLDDGDFLIDNYYVMVGTDINTYTGEGYYTDYYFNETVEKIILGSGETGDMATALGTIWDDFGLRSLASRLITGLFLMFLLAIVMFGASLSFHVPLSPAVLIVVELFFMILLGYIRLLPVWLPFVIIIITAGIGALIVKGASY